MTYKHINKGNGNISIADSKGVWYNLKPNEEITIDVKRPGSGIIVEENKNTKINKSKTKTESES